MPNPSERDREVARDVLMGTGSISDVDFYRILDRCTAAIAQARAEEREVSDELAARLFAFKDFYDEDVPVDDIAWRIDFIWNRAREGHSGDCVGQPATCSLCMVESYRGVARIANGVIRARGKEA